MSEAHGLAVAPGEDLPPAGVDLRAEIAEHQSWRVEQAINRAGGNIAVAARLLRVSQLEFMRLQRGAPLRMPQATSLPRVPTDPCEIARIEGGVEVISRAAIRRLAAEGYAPRQIATRLGLRSPYFVEKVLRAEAELAKCGPLPEPERSA